MSSEAPSPVTLPPGLLHAASKADGKVVLVLGAGCSVPAPTKVPMARQCSREAYRSLLADGILLEGDCPNPDDLSILADTVYEKDGGRQAELVKRLPIDRFRRARANSGYLIAAALLRENVVSSVLTLNYDLAMEDALTQLSAFDVKKIARPEDMPDLGTHNVVYLHRNVNEADFETWVLRASALESEWQGRWEGMMAQVMLMSPVVVFAGLGSPAAVLLKTTEQIKKAIGAVDAYQADPSLATANVFFQALGLPPESFIRVGWNEFMRLLGDRVLSEQVDELQNVCADEADVEKFAVNNVDVLIQHLRSIGLVELGKLRASWLLQDECYTPRSTAIVGLTAHLLIAASAVVQIVNAHDVVTRSEVMEFRAPSRVVLTSAMLASGRGIRGWSAIEAEINRRRADLPRHEGPPRFAIVAGATGPRLSEVVAPPNIMFEERPAGDIMDEAPFVFFDAHDVSRTPDILRAVI